MSRTHDDTQTSRLFFRLLPVQAMIMAMGSINSIIDGVVAARSIGPEAMGVIGLYYTVQRILEAVGAVLLGGSAVLCGRYMGRGQTDRTNGVYSLTAALALLCGAALTAASFLAPGAIAARLGADEGLREPLAAYITGYAPGIIPMLLAQQIASFLQLERRNARCTLGIWAMIASNAALDVLFVSVLGWGTHGLALATSASCAVYFVILAQYYLTGKAQLVPRARSAAWRETGTLLKIGFPGALLVFCLAARSLVINRLLLRYAGETGLSALSAFNMVGGLILAVSIGAGAVTRMLTSISIGEEDREAIGSLARVLLTRALPLTAAIGALVTILSGPLAAVFFPDRSTEVFRLTRQLFAVYGPAVPLALLCCAAAGYMQAWGRERFVNVASVFDGFLSIVIPSALLAPLMGALGVWISLTLGVLVTSLLYPLFVMHEKRKLPRVAGEWLLLDPSFGGGSDRLDLTLRSGPSGEDPVGEVTRTAERVERFCLEKGLTARTASFAGLCMEEMAGNVVQHGFTADRKAHTLRLYASATDGGVALGVRDDCVPFDPKEREEMVSGPDPCANVGIRLTYALADEVSYRNLLGMNVLTIRVADGGKRPAGGR